MIYRISQLKPKFMEIADALNLEIKFTRGRLEFHDGDRRMILDWRETTGPTTERFIEKWIDEFRDAAQIILITMGYFTKKALRYVLSHEDSRDKISLIELGLRDYFEREFKPRMLSLHKTELISKMEDELKKEGLELEEYTCDFCRNKTITTCSICGSLLCGDHMLICPICREYFCHPSIKGRMCFFIHRCG